MEGGEHKTYRLYMSPAKVWFPGVKRDSGALKAFMVSVCRYLLSIPDSFGDSPKSEGYI